MSLTGKRRVIALFADRARGQQGPDVAGKRLQRIFRLYGPLEGWFDKSWKPSDLELVTDRVVNGSTNMNLRQNLISVAIASALAITSAYAETPDSVKTRIGDLKFEKGFPTEETKQKVFDEIDYQRAVQAYMWAYPAVSFEALRIGVKRDVGVDYNDLIIAESFSGPEGLWLTSNDTTIYGLANVDLGKGRSSSRCLPDRSSG